jgi:hypothetical protein
MQTTIIGIGNKARHGKNVVADVFAAAAPGDVRLYSWAGALKAFCRVALGMREKDGRLLQLVGTDYFRLGHKGRVAAIDALRGTPAFEPLRALYGVLEHDPDIWVRVLLDTIAEDAPRYAVIPDTRFPNEAAACDITVNVTRWQRIAASACRTCGREGTDHPFRHPFMPIDICRETPFVTADRDPHHVSETALDAWAWTYCIRNDGTLDDLKEQARTTWGRIRRAECAYPILESCDHRDCLCGAPR